MGTHHIKHRALWVSVGAVGVSLGIVVLVVFVWAAVVEVDQKQLAEMVAAAVVAANKTVSTPTDYSGIATLVAAIGVALVTVINTLVALRQGKKLDIQDGKLDKQAEKIEQVKVNTDGQLTKLMEAVEGKNKAEGELKGRRDRESEQAGVVEEVKKVAAAVAEIAATKDVAASDTLKEAKDLLQAAQTTVMNKPTEPVPVTIVGGPGKDEPMKVQETGDKK